MIRVLLFLAMASPAMAQSLPAFEGRWRGEGDLALGTEPLQRFRCQLRLEPLRTGETFLVGRCATAQVHQSFAYLLTEDADGTLHAQNTETVEDGLPSDLLGTAAPGVLRLEGSQDALLELRREGETLQFTIAGHDLRGPARGDAVLERRE
ncbi:hypothetical protein [Pararhodobacter zhoushanensis]|uniref:Protease inhibitor Inh n=1 Tax=Pararhodobacter zhoushanensis TaxID=2479545 RepID=A0ABT3GWC1_9RHOB|nr:hypothetical protein [Pararhodobacter zhoushanensis]MCW1931848.1 hypothetical protein [Pararhodobacter zhoushanensis]